MSGGRWKQRIECPVPGCEQVTARCNMGTHLIGGKHGWPKQKAWDVAKRAPGLPAPEEEPALVPAVVAAVPAKRGRPPRLDWEEVDPAEMALGIIGSQTATVPVELLAEVIAYVDHTRVLIAALRQAR